MTNIALGIEYHGTHYHGWQAQQNLLTVQGALELALSKIADEPITVFCAGRTDAGVHAMGQVIHFQTQAVRDPRAWTLGVNTHLPSDISVRWVKEVDETFHARYSALARCYCYIIHNSHLRSALAASRATWIYHPLNAERMHTAAQVLLGEQDFSSFRSAQCESHSPMRRVDNITVTKQGEFVTMEIQANAFLHHMVRNITGSLIQIGAGWKEPKWLQDVLYAKNRRMAAETAPPQGLYLKKVIYPKEYDFPDPNQAHFIL